MLHIILVILKFIGIALLAILGLITTILLVVLLVPIRYRVQVAHGDQIHLSGRVSWLLHMIHIRIMQEGEIRRILFRLFGIVVYDSARPIKPKKLRRRREKAARKKRKAGGKRVSSPELSRVRNAHKDKKEVHKAVIPVKDRDQSGLRKDVTVTAGYEKGKDNFSEVAHEEDIRKNIDSFRPIADASLDQRITEDIMTEDSVDPKTEGNVNPMSESDPYTDYSEETGEEAKESRLMRVLHKVKRIFFGIFNTLKRIKQGIKQGFAKLFDIKHKINLIKEFISDEENKEALGVAFGSLKKLLKHIFPKKLKSKLIFGTGDPCTTGQALGAFSVLYSFYGDNIQITPDFENKVFEGSHYARGRIRIGTLLIIVIKLLLDKKFNGLKRNFKILKEAL